MHSLDSTTCATITDDFLKVDEVFKTSIRSVDDTDDEDDDVVENHGRKAKITFITDSGHYFSVHRQLLETDTKVRIDNTINFLSHYFRSVFKPTEFKPVSYVLKKLI